jgi:hypothetical protein
MSETICSEETLDAAIAQSQTSSAVLQAKRPLLHSEAGRDSSCTRTRGDEERHDGGTQRTTPRYEEEFGGCRAPPASFIRPLALSIAPSFLSRRPRFVPTVRSLLLSQSASRHANPKPRASASRVIPPRLSPRSRRSRMSCSSSHLLLLPRRR